MLEIPIRDRARQRFSVSIQRRRITLDLWYSPFADRWSVDISIDGVLAIQGRRVVTGANLLEGASADVGIMFAYGAPGVSPGRDELPSGQIRIYHTTQAEIDEALAAQG